MGLDQARYEKDLAECQAYATANPEADGAKQAKKAAKKWGIGTALGLGAATILTGGLAAVPIMAGTIAVGGGGTAVLSGVQAKGAADAKYQSVVSNCLSGRGYKVLG